MTKQLKFRDWDPETKEMRYFHLDGYDREVYNAYGNIMQYTGLEDNNGKEIFEGDILIFYIRLDADIDDAGHVFKCKGQVIFDNGTFIIKNIEPKVRPFFYFDWDEMKIGEHCEELYVGGNIYQNPERVGN
jgi:uncharacterized phage protein (TIGR01671 family)